MVASPITSTSSGVAYSQREDSFEAGAEIARSAMANKSLATETLFFLFATVQHKIDELIKGARSVVGEDVKFFGCTSSGVVCGNFISYAGIIAGGGYISSDSPFFQLFYEATIKDREYEAGKSLAASMKQASVPDDAAILLFYDSIKQTSVEGQPQLNIATPILEGFRDGYGSWPLMAGIGTFGDMNFALPCNVWVNRTIERHLLGAAAITGSIKMDTIILRGTRPIGGYHKITKAEKDIIYELNGKPALEVIAGILGNSVSWEEYPLFVTLGVNNGDKYGPYDEDNYFSRLCFSIDKEKKALIMFETDLVEGLEVQLMRRDIDFEYIQPRVQKLFEKLEKRKPVFALYIDCVGRVSAYSGISEEESLEVAKAVGNVPFFGIFSGVEIANVAKDVKALDWTGVLCIFSKA